MNKIRKGDQVVVTAGKDKGKRGTVMSVKDDRVVVEGLNRVRKHVKPNPIKGMPGGVIDKDMPLHISNVLLYNPTTKKADRVGFRLIEDKSENGGKKITKVRFFKSNGELVEA
ncbi:MAG: 50S ribosomal protein L24 [Candidatus Accumulibacter sp.]|jgi:large subunit ribosomal protein L24|nr:50S ribosomal protein L24 [Accumulibacter sp.]